MSIVARRLADLTCSVLGCRRVSISIVEPGTELVRAVAIVGLTPEQERQWWAEQKQQESSLRDSPSQELISVLRSHEVLILDMSQPPYNEQPNNYGVRVVLVAPMVVGGQLVGLLSLDHGGLEHTYTQEEIALAKAVAKLAGLVIERERLLYERAEARANELALRESHQRMDEFLSMASHELRTPLTTIKGNVQLSKRQLKKLAGTITKPEELNGQIGAIEGLLERADHQVSFLTRLVGDLLDASRIQANMLELHIEPEPSDLVAIVRMAVQDQRRALPKRTLHLQALSETVQSGSSVGLGLGLHICRTIIERHHGRVGVQSAPGKGATFWFVLPLAGDA
jgi:signal transduction histidine kinase